MDHLFELLDTAFYGLGQRRNIDFEISEIFDELGHYIRSRNSLEKDFLTCVGTII